MLPITSFFMTQLQEKGSDYIAKQWYKKVIEKTVLYNENAVYTNICYENVQCLIFL